MKIKAIKVISNKDFVSGDYGVRAIFHILDYKNYKFDFFYLYSSFSINEQEECTFYILEEGFQQGKAVVSNFTKDKDEFSLDIIPMIQEVTKWNEKEEKYSTYISPYSDELGVDTDGSNLETLAFEAMLNVGKGLHKTTVL